MNALASFSQAVDELLSSRVNALRHMTFARALQLPEASGQLSIVEGRERSVTTFRQLLSSGECLVVVQISRSTTLGLGTRHWERGLMFSAAGDVREATKDELLASGG